MSERWFVAQDSKSKQGPFTLGELRELARSGKLRPSDLVWKEGTSQWVAASSVQGLFENIGAQAPQALPVPSSDVLPTVAVVEPVLSGERSDAHDDSSLSRRRGTIAPGVTSGQGWIIIFLLFLTLLASLGIPICPLCRTAVPPTVWEYKVTAPTDSALEGELRQLGDDGWELVYARRAVSEFGPAKYEMIFKRKKR
jgi:hypothetical protein